MTIITFIWLSLRLRGSNNTYHYTHSSKWWKCSGKDGQNFWGQWDGSGGRGACSPYLGTPEFDPQSPHKGERRKRLSKVFLWPTHTHHGMYAHTDTCVGCSRSLVRKLLLDLPPQPGRMHYWLDTGQCQGKPATEAGLELWSPLLVCLLSFTTEDNIITLEKCCELRGAGMHNILAPNCKWAQAFAWTMSIIVGSELTCVKDSNICKSSLQLEWNKGKLVVFQGYLLPCISSFVFSKATRESYKLITAHMGWVLIVWQTPW